MAFDTHVEGTDRPAHALTAPRPVEYPLPLGPRVTEFRRLVGRRNALPSDGVQPP